MKEKYDIGGMTCSACSAHVEKAVKKVTGLKNINVNLLQNLMTIEYNEDISKSKAEEIIKEVTNVGYTATLKGKNDEATTKNTVKKDNEIENMKARLIISFIFLIPLFYIAMGHMLKLPMPNIFMGKENMLVFALTQFFLTLPIIYVNRKYYIVGYKSLWRRSPNMDSLIALGSSAAMIYSIYLMFNMAYLIGHNMEISEGDFSLYFESAGMILTLITVGKTLEARSKKKTFEAIEKLINLAPKTATVLRDNKEIEIAIDEVIKNDIVIVKSGMSIPVDGIIIEGAASIDEAALTGESIPVTKSINNKVMSATINKSGYIKIKAVNVGEGTVLSQIIKLVEDATGSKAPIARLADKVSGVFVPIVITIAIIAMISWMLLGYSFEYAISIGIAILVISCPCALGLATPTAIMVGTGKGAENGILIKSAESLEIAHKINTVVLDKTGTVTEGKPKVTDIIESKEFSKNYFLRVAYSLEKKSEHPLAEAIVKYSEENKIELIEISEFERTEGQGIRGKIKDKIVFAGNSKMMKENNINISGFEEKHKKFSSQGKTCLYFAMDNSTIGMIAIADTIKSTSKSAVKSLKKMGIEVIMLTGDNRITAEAIRKEAEIDTVIAEVLPQEKEEKIREIQKQGKITAMIGDGINDAPALARADVGIAIGAGTDIAIDSADIVLMKSDLTDAVTAIELSKKVIKNIKENLFWAFFYNVLGIPLAAGIFGMRLNPMFAATAMSLSSVFVVTNALRLKLFKAKNKNYGKNNNELKEKKIMKKTIKIEGMMCGHCTGRVDKALNEIDGVNAEVSLEDKAAYITIEEDKNITDEKLKDIITSAGYEVTEIIGG